MLGIHEVDASILPKYSQTFVAVYQFKIVKGQLYQENVVNILVNNFKILMIKIMLWCQKFETRTMFS